jgi:hypothetical protein
MAPGGEMVVHFCTGKHNVVQLYYSVISVLYLIYVCISGLDNALTLTNRKFWI